MKRKNQIKPGGALHMLDIQLSIKRAKSAAELAQAVAEHGRDMKPQQLVQALQQVREGGGYKRMLHPRRV